MKGFDWVLGALPVWGQRKGVPNFHGGGGKEGFMTVEQEKGGNRGILARVWSVTPHTTKEVRQS